MRKPANGFIYIFKRYATVSGLESESATKINHKSKSQITNLNKQKGKG